MEILKKLLLHIFFYLCSFLKFQKFFSLILNKTCLIIIEDSFGYELLTLAPATSADEPIGMSPIVRSELGDAISRRARFFSALDQFWICSFPAATSSANFTNPRSMWNPNGQHWHFSAGGGLPTIIDICCCCYGYCLWKSHGIQIVLENLKKCLFCYFL
jgi:hypothetical protein